MTNNDAARPQSDGRRLTIRLPRLGYALALLIAIGLVVPWLYGHVRDARERARRAPHVSVFGTGTVQHVMIWFYGTGEPPSEVNRLVGEAVDHFLKDDLPREIEFARWLESKGLPHSRAVQLQIGVPKLSASALGRLQEAPRSDGIHLSVLIAASQITDDGLAGLKSLANVDSLIVRGALLPPPAAAALKEALPDCTVEIAEPVAD
jgi:hypothetical protein